jgi:hypothetical protein
MKNEGHGNNFYDPNLVTSQAQEYDDLHVVCPPHTTESKLMRKIDARVIPFLCILYLLAFLDRVNIANAKAFHLTTDLNLKKIEYNTALTIFFVPYIVGEFSNAALHPYLLLPHSRTLLIYPS